MAVWGRARYLSVTEAPHNTDFHTWMGKKHLCFFQTAETGNRTPNSGVKGSGANHYPRAPAHIPVTARWKQNMMSYQLQQAGNRIWCHTSYSTLETEYDVIPVTASWKQNMMSYQLQHAGNRIWCHTSYSTLETEYDVIPATARCKQNMMSYQLQHATTIICWNHTSYSMLQIKYYDVTACYNQNMMLYQLQYELQYRTSRIVFHTNTTGASFVDGGSCCSRYGKTLRRACSGGGRACTGSSLPHFVRLCREVAPMPG